MNALMRLSSIFDLSGAVLKCSKQVPVQITYTYAERIRQKLN